MKIVFVSNFYNHHQAFISRKLFQLTEGNYRFIATAEVPQERKTLGYSSHTDNFVIQYASKSALTMEWIDTADVVVCGSAPQYLFRKRKKERKKLIFKYSEHLFKKGFQWWKYPVRWIRMHRHIPSNAPIYMLCASAYTSSDYSKMGLFKGKTYKWGYFPECKRYDDIGALIAHKNPQEILWCGRFLDWKHPDDVLTVAKRLKDENYNFHINIIGAGEMENTLKQFVLENDLSEQVSLLGSMSPEKVREHMEKSGIFLFTSDRKEGWGAVLNEAMNSACAVIASTEAGSTPYLIRHGENGLAYSSSKVDELFENAKYLLQHPEEQARLGQAAYETITTEWNADIAAERLVALATRILNGEKYPDLYSEGPCSRA